MPTLTISISTAGDWPTTVELARRNTLEVALRASKLMECTGTGGGLREMQLAFRVADDAQVKPARAAVESEIARLLPGCDYKVVVQNEPARDIQVKVGDIFLIPLAHEKYAIGLCRHVFQTYEGFMACRVLDVTVPEPKPVAPLPESIAFDPLFVSDHSIVDGTWPIVGHSQVEPAPLLYRSAGGIYDGDSYLKSTDYAEGVPDFYLRGPVAIVTQLREHFGLSPVEAGDGRTQHST